MTQPKATVITATYRIVTPMFCAGADQNSAELRVPSFKGALRFWWRSLMWNQVSDHNDLRQREAELFGASDSTIGQSKVRLRITQSDLANTMRPAAVFENGRLLGTHYLGYGVMEAFDSKKKGTKAGQLTRGMISGGTFSIECRLSPLATENQINQVQRALFLVGTAGGLGSKSRKGYGSLTLTHFSRNGEMLSVHSNPVDRLKSTIPILPSGTPDWPAWCQDVRVVVARASDAQRPVELLDRIGREEVHFRSWGRYGEVFGSQSEKNFPLDHDMSKHQSVSIDYPLRVAFGLPHNYGKGRANSVKPEHYDRRASPLFIHIDQQREGGVPIALLAFLRSRFLPAGEELQAFDATVSFSTDAEFWCPIDAFLDRLIADSAKPGSRPGYERFPKENEWWRKKTLITAEEVNLG